MKKIFALILKHKPIPRSFEILKYIGPGLLVTVGFIDPGNWAANVAAGSMFGYKLLWMVTLSTIILIILQHNAAHLGIVTGLCISEAATKHFKKAFSIFLLITAIGASISTALAEILGAAIGLKMLFDLPLILGSLLTVALVLVMIISNSYRKLERWIIGFVSIIGLSFLYELTICKVDWVQAGVGWIEPNFPIGSIPIIMSVLGAVVMPHNLFLHSEIIQSRQWNLADETIKKRQLKYEFTDTFFAMGLGWAINSAMIIVAASVFFASGVSVTDLAQAKETLVPLLGNSAADVFAFALLCAGIASSVTAALAGGSIFAGIFKEPFQIRDPHSKMGVFITLFGALAIIFFLHDPFKGLIWSQIVLSIQLPWTIITLLLLTSSKKVMGKYANSLFSNILYWSIAGLVFFFNALLLVNVFQDV